LARDAAYGAADDWWAVGWVAYELLFGDMPILRVEPPPRPKHPGDAEPSGGDGWSARLLRWIAAHIGWPVEFRRHLAAAWPLQDAEHAAMLRESTRVRARVARGATEGDYKNGHDYDDDDDDDADEYDARGRPKPRAAPRVSEATNEFRAAVMQIPTKAQLEGDRLLLTLMGDQQTFKLAKQRFQAHRPLSESSAPGDLYDDDDEFDGEDKDDDVETGDEEEGEEDEEEEEGEGKEEKKTPVSRVRGGGRRDSKSGGGGGGGGGGGIWNAIADALSGLLQVDPMRRRERALDSLLADLQACAIVPGALDLALPSTDNDFADLGHLIGDNLETQRLATVVWRNLNAQPPPRGSMRPDDLPDAERRLWRLAALALSAKDLEDRFPQAYLRLSPTEFAAVNALESIVLDRVHDDVWAGLLRPPKRLAGRDGLPLSLVPAVTAKNSQPARDTVASSRSSR
jgi:hypothetical protein